MRLFTAICFSDDLVRHISTYQKKVNDAFHHLRWKMRWVDQDALHLTLFFIGEFPETLFPNLRRDLTGVAAHTTPFQISLGEVDFFPGLRKRPKVLHIEVDDHSRSLPQLHDSMAKVLRKYLSSKTEHDFHPHVTIAKIKNAGNPEVEALLEFPRLVVEVRSFDLIESELTPKGSIYTLLETFEFQSKIQESVGCLNILSADQITRQK